jgi:lysyl-tRNA synthetase class 2
MATRTAARWTPNPGEFRVAGRMLAKRIMGKASFARLRDMSGDIQYLFRKRPAGRPYETFKGWDLGDILGAEGVVFKTKTGELSVKVDALRLLTKSLRPLPEKFHGLADQETRYRQRYVDLIMNESTRATFKLRSAASPTSASSLTSAVFWKSRRR